MGNLELLTKEDLEKLRERDVLKTKQIFSYLSKKGLIPSLSVGEDYFILDICGKGSKESIFEVNKDLTEEKFDSELFGNIPIERGYIYCPNSYSQNFQSKKEFDIKWDESLINIYLEPFED